MNETIADRVADAPADIWVYRLLPRAIWPYAQLARWDRPIGWWLLLWPCLWSLALALGAQQAELTQTLPLLVIGTFCFWLGAVMMRGAGCTYNDIVDVNIDAKVARTASRPIPSGRASKRTAWLFLLLQSLVGLACLIGLSFLGRQSPSLYVLLLGVASLVVVAFYPFAKRITDWPQFVLGLAFSWGALMGWGAVFEALSPAPLLLYVGSILWVIGYDTMYAHQDKEDDALIGVRSTARLFGTRTKPALIILYAATLVLFAIAFHLASAGWLAYVGLALGCLHMVWQIASLNIDDPDNCLALFKSNSIFGWILFAGLLADLIF